MSNNIKPKSVDVYGYPIEFTDKLDLLRKVLKIHAVVTNIDHSENFLRPRLVDVLSFYVLMGYSKSTKELILESLEITVKNLNQINSELSEKRYLIRDVHNFRIKHLSTELQQLRDYFTSDNNSGIFLIKFKAK